MNTQNEFGETPLGDCVSIDRWDNAKILVDHGARTDSKNHLDENIWEYLKEMGEQKKLSKLKNSQRHN